MTYVTHYEKFLERNRVKSLYDSVEPCWLCGLSWARGDAISKWLGDWVHEPCKAARATSVASEGVRTELPDARGWADKPDTLVRTKGRGKNFKSHVA